MQIRQRLINYLNRKIVYPQVLVKNKNLQNKYWGDRCFIVGNGPSLNKMDLRKLQKEYVFVLNNFFVHSEFNTIKPLFYSDIEPIYTFQTLPKDSVFHLDNYYANADKYLKGKGMNLFLNIQSKEYLEDKRLFEGNEIYYLESKGNILDSNKPGKDISKPNSFMDGVIYSSVCTSVYMGFKEICLIGCDFDHILNKQEAHFYENKEKTYLDGVSNKELAHNLYLYLAKMERIKEIFEKEGVKIYNAGIGGMTDTFERKDFNVILDLPYSKGKH